MTLEVHVRTPNSIGAGRAAIVLRDEGRILDHFSRSRRSAIDHGALIWDGNSLGVDVRSQEARLEATDDSVHLAMRYRLPRSAIVRIKRRTIEGKLRAWLAERFEHPCPPRTPKVFGIGMQRTGTTSLIGALLVLGYFGLHDAPWLLDGMLAGRVDWSLIDDYDAFADNPFPLLYRELDERYPGSKFILTVRDVDAWLASVRFLVEEWRPGFAMEEFIYGMCGFDAAVFRKRYLDHNEAVQEHFRSRPESLLTIDLSKDDPWPPICKFLELPVPNEPFPRAGLSSA